MIVTDWVGQDWIGVVVVGQTDHQHPFGKEWTTGDDKVARWGQTDCLVLASWLNYHPENGRPEEGREDDNSCVRGTEDGMDGWTPAPSSLTPACAFASVLLMHWLAGFCCAAAISPVQSVTTNRMDLMRPTEGMQCG